MAGAGEEQAPGTKGDCTHCAGLLLLARVTDTMGMRVTTVGHFARIQDVSCFAIK